MFSQPMNFHRSQTSDVKICALHFKDLTKQGPVAWTQTFSSPSLKHHHQEEPSQQWYVLLYCFSKTVGLNLRACKEADKNSDSKGRLPEILRSSVFVWLNND